MSSTTVTVKIMGRRRARKIKLFSSAKITDLLKLLNLSPEVVAVRRNGKIVVEGERLFDDDSIEILPIVTGG
jgi:sulfur carrier protein ThiS